jgi:hypothetical protein
MPIHEYRCQGCGSLTERLAERCAERKELDQTGRVPWKTDGENSQEQGERSQPCQDETVQDPLDRDPARVEDRDEEQEEVVVVVLEAAGDKVGWEGRGLAQARAVNASAPPVGRQHPIRQESRVSNSYVPAVEAKWFANSALGR